MKKLLTLALFLLIATPVSAKLLYEYGSFEERAELAVDYEVVEDISQYYGNLDQNLLLLNALEPKLGTSIPSIVAVFETSLATKITSTQTTMTLVSGTTDDSTTLSGTYGFVIDEGSASQEFVLATCADTACTSMTRGISTVTGTSSVTALKSSHRRGASVKITDHPVLLTLINILTGKGNLPSKLVYDGLTISAGDSSDTLVDKAYADAIVSAGISTSTESVFGGITLATPTEMASSTYDVENPKVPNSRYATSTPWSDTIGAGYTCVTEDDGNISSDCLPFGDEVMEIATTTQWGVFGGLMPAGSITAYATSTAPQGWLAADGSEIASTTYASLFAVIGYTYGGTPGGDFNLPNLNGRNIIGFGSATTTIDTMGETGGEDEHLLTHEESGLPAHTHAIPSSASYAGTGIPAAANDTTVSATNGTSANTAADASSAHNVLDPFIVLRYIIKY